MGFDYLCHRIPNIYKEDQNIGSIKILFSKYILYSLSDEDYLRMKENLAPQEIEAGCCILTLLLVFISDAETILKPYLLHNI